MGGACRAGLFGGDLAPEIILVNGSQPGVGIGGSDHAKLVGIDAELLFQLQAIAKGSAGVLVLQHFGLFQFREIEVALVPALVIGEFVVG